METEMAPENCPNCGADVPPTARACPACGACEETGWSDEAIGGTADLPEEDFDYEDFVQREFGPEKAPAAVRGRGWYFAAIVLLVAFVWFVAF